MPRDESGSPKLSKGLVDGALELAGAVLSLEEIQHRALLELVRSTYVGDVILSLESAGSTELDRAAAQLVRDIEEEVAGV